MKRIVAVLSILMLALTSCMKESTSSVQSESVDISFENDMTSVNESEIQDQYESLHSEPDVAAYTTEDRIQGALFRGKVGEKYGYIDSAGITKIDYQYDYAAEFSEGLAYARIGDLKGYIDESGEFAFFLDYRGMEGEEAGPFNSEGLAPVIFTGGGSLYRYGFIDRSGEWVFDAIFSRIGEFNEGIMPVQFVETGLWGFITAAGEYIGSSDYHDVGCFSEGLAAVCKSGKYGYIDADGEIVIDFKYGDGQIFSNGLAAVEHDGKYGYIDREDHVVIDYQYDYARPFIKEYTLAYPRYWVCEEASSFGIWDRETSWLLNYQIINMHGDIMYNCEQILLNPPYSLVKTSDVNDFELLVVDLSNATVEVFSMENQAVSKANVITDDFMRLVDSVWKNAVFITDENGALLGLEVIDQYADQEVVKWSSDILTTEFVPD